MDFWGLGLNTGTAIVIVVVTGLLGAAVLAALCQLVKPDEPQSGNTCG